jgi:hypothetical protein
VDHVAWEDKRENVTERLQRNNRCIEEEIPGQSVCVKCTAQKDFQHTTCTILQAKPQYKHHAKLQTSMQVLHSGLAHSPFSSTSSMRRGKVSARYSPAQGGIEHRNVNQK